MTQNSIHHYQGLLPFPGNLPKSEELTKSISFIPSCIVLTSNIDLTSEQNSPETEKFTFRRLDNSVHFINLNFNKETCIPAVYKPIHVDRDIYDRLSYQCLFILLT